MDIKIINIGHVTSILKLFFAALVADEIGLKCPDSGFIDFSTGQECSDAVSFAKVLNRKAKCQYQGSWQPKHKGCLVYDSGEMYFNLHFSGGNQADSSRSICKKG